MKKVFAWILACLMIVSSLPVVALAGDDAHLRVTDAVEPHTEHVWSETFEIIEYPCVNKDGVALYTCEECSETKQVRIAYECSKIEDHTWQVTKEANGCWSAEYACAYCDAVKSAKSEHLDIRVDEYVAPTCTATGLTEGKHCEACGEIIVAQNKIAPEHVGPFEIIPGVEPTCHSTGWTEGKRCTACEEIAVPREKLDFKHNWSTVVIEPTCTEPGYTEEKCEGCHDVRTSNYVAPLGHDLVLDKASSTAPTCLQKGENVWECSRCDYQEKKPVNAKGHTKSEEIRLDVDCRTLLADLIICLDPNCDGEKVSTYLGKDGAEYDVTVNGQSVCVVTLTQLDEKGSHQQINEKILNPATCEEVGNYTAYCPVCDHWDFYSIPALGHDYDANGDGKINDADAVIVQASCAGEGTKGSKTWTCQREGCGKDKSEEIPAPAHKEAVETVAPTCGEDGYTRTYCSVCNKELNRKPIAKPVFDPNRWYETYDEAAADHDDLAAEGDCTVIREGSCGVRGLLQYHCACCDKNVLVVIADTGLGHRPAYDISLADATCTADGYYYWNHAENGKETVTEYVCTYCDETVTLPVVGAEAGIVYYSETKGETVEISAPIGKLGHDEKAVVAEDPTCTKDGNTAYTYCARCNEILEGKKEILSALGHDYDKDGDGTVNGLDAEIVQPTCTEAGSLTWTCQREDCGHSYDETIPALGHEMEIVDYETSCTEIGYIHTDCVRCENDEDAEHICGFRYPTGHTWGEWRTNVEPTYTTKGQQIRYCEVCDERETREIDADVDVVYTLTASNEIPNAAVVDSSLVKVTVNMASYGVDVWGAYFEIAYDSDILEYVDAEILNENFTINSAVDQGSLVAVATGMKPIPGGDADDVYVTDSKLVTLTFKVISNNEEKSDAEIVNANVTIQNIQTLDPESTELRVLGEGDGVTIEIDKFLDINNDNVIDLVDVKAVADMIMTTGTYDAVVDINKDGAIDLIDFEAIFYYLTGKKGYTYTDLMDMCA